MLSASLIVIWHFILIQTALYVVNWMSRIFLILINLTKIAEGKRYDYCCSKDCLGSMMVIKLSYLTLFEIWVFCPFFFAKTWASPFRVKRLEQIIEFIGDSSS